MTTHAQQVADLEALTSDYFAAAPVRSRLKPLSDERLLIIAQNSAGPDGETACFVAAEYAGRTLHEANRRGNIVSAAASDWDLLNPDDRVQRLKWFLKQLETMP